MSTLEHALKAKERLSRRLLGKPGIVGIGVSTIKQKAGININMGSWGVVVYVEKKLPPEQVPSDLLVPRSLSIEGVEVWTDVIESGRITSLQCGCNQSKCRPLEAGVSICDCELTACTYTGAFRDRSTGKVYLLTNAHCTKASATCNPSDLVNRPMAQPSPYDGGVCPGDVVGYVVRASNIFQNGKTDTALIDPAPGIDYINILHAAGIAFSGRYRTPSPGETVYKSGRSTFVSSGVVQSVHTDVRLNYRCLVRTVYDTIVTQPILQPGDSGSPVLSQNGDFVGQGFAGSQFVSLLIDPNNIVAEFNVEPIPAQQPSPTPSPSPSPASSYLLEDQRYVLVSPAPSPTPSPTPTPVPDWLLALIIAFIIIVILVLLILYY
jgi:hypothetical protein